MSRWNHAYDIAFTVISEHSTGEDVTPTMFRDALLARIRELDKCGEWSEVLTSLPFDSYEEDAP
jgi:hypothetical protein